MKRRFLIPLLALTLLVTAGWGYSQFQARRQWEINAENQYQRAYHELNGHMSNMENLMSKALVASSFPQSVTLLTNIWREANSCTENLGQLPLTSMELSRTKTLLANASAFCFNAAQNKLLKGTSFSNNEWKTLDSLRNQTRVATKHLLGLQQNFFTTRASWLDVDRIGSLGAAGAAGALHDNKVTKAFLMLEDGLRRTPDVSFQGNNLDFQPKPTGLTGANISSREAVAIARKFSGPIARGKVVRYERMIKGSFPSYLVGMSDPRHPETDRRFSISVKGGHIVWMLGNRAIKNTKLNLSQSEGSAKSFLDSHGYPGMVGVAREHFANIATVSFCPLRDKVLYYPELIKVQVAMDNGEILGFDASAFLTFHNPSVLSAGQPRYSQSQIRQLLNQHLSASSIGLAQVLDEMFNKVLCYEVKGSQGQDRYLIYYNATTGKEEKIRRVDNNGNEVL